MRQEKQNCMEKIYANMRDIYRQMTVYRMQEMKSSNSEAIHARIITYLHIYNSYVCIPLINDAVDAVDTALPSIHTYHGAVYTAIL